MFKTRYRNHKDDAARNRIRKLQQQVSELTSALKAMKSEIEYGSNLNEKIEEAVEEYLDDKIEEAVEEHFDQFDLDDKIENWIGESNLVGDDDLDQRISDHESEYHDDALEDAVSDALDRFMDSDNFRIQLRTSIAEQLRNVVQTAVLEALEYQRQVDDKETQQIPAETPKPTLLETAQRKISAIWGVIKEK